MTPECPLARTLEVKQMCSIRGCMRLLPTKVMRFCGVQIGGSGVLVQPMTYIFDEEPERWCKLVKELES